MQDPSFRPPLPTPDGQIAPPLTPTYAPGDWQSAPPVVKGWAYPLTWLGIVLQSVLILGVIGMSAGLGVLGAILSPRVLLSVVMLATQIYLNRTLKKRVPAAWTVQIALSGFIIAYQAYSLATAGTRGALGIGGILIHGYILSQWFKPEVKAWFQRS